MASSRLSMLHQVDEGRWLGLRWAESSGGGSGGGGRCGEGAGRRSVRVGVAVGVGEQRLRKERVEFGRD
jgi:hypothetical protein